MQNAARQRSVYSNLAPPSMFCPVLSTTPLSYHCCFYHQVFIIPMLPVLFWRDLWPRTKATDDATDKKSRSSMSSRCSNHHLVVRQRPSLQAPSCSPPFCMHVFLNWFRATAPWIDTIIVHSELLATVEADIDNHPVLVCVDYYFYS